MGFLVTQVRAVIAAAGLLGTIGFLYAFGAPWIVWIVDQWGVISKFLLGWMPFDFTEFQSALIASVTIFGLAALIGMRSAFIGLRSPIIDRRSNPRHSIFSWMPILFTFMFVAFLLFLPMILDRVNITTILLIGYLLFLLIVSSLYARTYTISVTFWIGVAFFLDRLYRLIGTPDLTPPGL